MTTTRKASRAVATGVLAATLLAGCKDFLTSNAAINNPNNPTAASATQLLTGVETNQTALQTGDPARLITSWMQQFSGTQGQYQSNSLYNVTPDFADGYWGTVYQGGGLVDLRSIEAQSDAVGDSVTAGIARTIEAFTIGTAADWWGDIPYSQALRVGSPAPLDKQAAVYAAVQSLLDRAISQLSSGKGNGPGAADLWYGGDATKWVAAANSLKARFYLHTAEAAGTAADGTPGYNPAAYQSALAVAQKGITAPANDLRSYQSTNSNERNLWYQFTVLARAGYISPSDYFVNLLKSRNDPRLTTYFAPGDTNQVIGSPVAGSVPGYIATLNGGAGNPGAPDYRQPMVTYAETQLIIAESQFRLGNQAAALTALNAERSAGGLTTYSALSSGAAGLGTIMTEKYIALFQNPEVWSDYRRTCVPPLTPPPGAQGRIPARFFYPLNETNTNPNIPADQPARNANDPNPCYVNGVQTSD